MTPPVLKKVKMTIQGKEQSMAPKISKIGPYAIKRRGVKRLSNSPKWSLKQVEMGMQVNVSTIQPECAPFLKNPFMNWKTWLQNCMSDNFKTKRDFTRLLGTGLGVLSTTDSEVLMNKLTSVGSDLIKLQQPLQSSVLALGDDHWKLSKILPDWENTEEQDHELMINALGTASKNVSLALGCTQAQLWMQSVATAVIREGGEGTLPAEIQKNCLG